MLSENKTKMLDFYTAGLNLYKEMKFKEALESFKQGLKISPDDGPTKLYIARCIELSKNPPPPEWDGVFTMTTK
jgi:hypothetical protein